MSELTEKEIIPTKLFAVRAKSDYINNLMFSKIEEKEFVFESIHKNNCKTYFENGDLLSGQPIPAELLARCYQLTPGEQEYELNQLLNNLPCSPVLSLKKGALVMCTVNIDMENGICNGSCGTVVDILEKNGDTRFIGNAVDSIINYTSRNPYYIQIFCARLVDYMNRKKNIRVTEADVKEVAETFIEGSQALAPEKFDNLIRAGEEHDFKEFDDEPIVKILRQIAIGSKNIGVCSRDNISLNNKELENKILNHLVDREVLEHKQGDNYKIQVKLFQEWLLRH
jgi:hypothetical protein